MLSQPPVITDRPKVAPLYWKLKDERMIRHFDVGAWGIIRRRKNLYPRTSPKPRTQHAEAAETILAPHLERSGKKRLLDFLANPLPLGRIERWTRLYGDDMLVTKAEHDSAR
jgi:hypothetical protein